MEGETWAALAEGLELLQAALTTSSSHEVRDQLSVELPPSCNLTTMFGLLLGYPVTYWSDPSQV